VLTIGEEREKNNHERHTFVPFLEEKGRSTASRRFEPQEGESEKFLHLSNGKEEKGRHQNRHLGNEKICPSEQGGGKESTHFFS